MNLGSGLSANPHSSHPSLEEELEPQTLDGNPTLAVWNNAILTVGSESLIILDEGLRTKPGLACCGVLTSQFKVARSIRFFNILWADISDDSITIRYAEPVSKTDVSVASINYPIDPEQKVKAEAWVASLLNSAYGKAQRKKRIKVLINPFGGKGRAQKQYLKDVEPIFVAASCEIDTETTMYRGHAMDIAKNIDIDAYDVVAPCSGDGVVYEVFNGLAKKPNAGEALAKIALAHIPCGTGNAMSWNLNGTGSASMAALCIVKGLRTPLDLVSITQGDRRTLSFLSQSFGIVAESDLGTENIRWMGSARFTFGFLVRLLGKTVYPCDLAIKVDLDDKQNIKDHYQMEVRKTSTPRDNDGSSQSVGLPPLKYGTATDPLPNDWTLIPYNNLGNFYAGNMAYMAADANFFPASLPSDGFLDLVTINGDISRRTALQMLRALDNGTLFDMPDVKVRKISGYRIIPKDRKEGHISIDGEKVPFEPFQAEVHKGLGTVLSRSGHKYESKGVV